MAEQTKFTPAPWKANLHHTQDYAGRTHGFIFADGIVPLAAVVLGVEAVSQSEGRANAHVMTAAPEMFAALEHVKAALLSGSPDGIARDGVTIYRLDGEKAGNALNAVRIALAKALGKEP